MPLTSTAGRVALAVGVLSVIAIAVGVRHKSSGPVTPKQPVTPANPYAQMSAQMTQSAQMAGNMPDMAREAMAQVAMMKLMTTNGLDQESANYFRQVQTEVVSQSDKSIHYIQTFPEGAKADTTVTLTPGQHYTPTPAEMERAARTGTHIYNVKLTTQAQGPKRVRITVQYFVPYSAIPTPLQQNLHLQTAAGGFFGLVPGAWAQGSGEGPGVAIASDTTMETFKEFTKQVIEKMTKGTELAEYGPNLTYGLLYGLSGIQKYMEHAEWMSKLDEMEACAKETPLTNKTMENPDNPTQNGLDNTRSEIRQVSAVRGLNVATAFASMFVPGIFGTVMTPVATWNDESLKSLGEQDLQDAQKSVPTCKEQPGRSVTFEYSYTRPRNDAGGTGEVTRTATGEFDLKTDPYGWNVVGGEGAAKIQWKENFKNLTTKQHRTVTGPLELEVKGQGAPRQETLDVTFHGENLTDVFSCTGCEKTGVPNYTGTNAGFTRSCHFEGIDLVRGGNYSTPVDLEEGYGTCKIGIPPQ